MPEINRALREGKISLAQRDDLVKRLADPEIVNDRVEEARLTTQATNIWKGAISKQEFDADLLANSDKLDDEAYRRVSTAATTTLKSSQAEALSRADKEIIRAIVDFASETAMDRFIAESIKGLSPEAKDLFTNNANEERQLQFWAVSRYNAELRQWIQENPDKLGKDFFQFSESLKHDYWNRSIEDIRRLRARTAAEFTAATFLEANPISATPTELPVITNKAEYDRLPKGTRYRDTKGNITVKRQ